MLIWTFSFIFVYGFLSLPHRKKQNIIIERIHTLSLTICKLFTRMKNIQRKTKVQWSILTTSISNIHIDSYVLSIMEGIRIKYLTMDN